jgi:hypothetical protein
MVAEQLLHLHPASLLLMLLNKLFVVMHMVTSNVKSAYVHMKKNRSSMSANCYHGKCRAVAWSCTSVIYSCLYGVQDLQYTCVRQYSNIAKDGKLHTDQGPTLFFVGM